MHGGGTLNPLSGDPERRWSHRSAPLERGHWPWRTACELVAGMGVGKRNLTGATKKKLLSLTGPTPRGALLNRAGPMQR